MGAPTSPLIADIFMNDLEMNIFNSKSPLLNNVLLWKRYVDDIFCIWTGSERQLDTFLKFLNSLHSQIQFTIEIGNNATLNFLDLTLSITNNKIEFNIYRKPTYTDTVIHNTSNHPISQKHSAFHSMIHRLVNVPMSDNNFFTELSIIKQIAVNNGYDPNLVNKILNKKLNKISAGKFLFNTNFNNNIDIQWRRILYINDFSILCTKNLPTSIKPAFYTKNNIGNFLKNAKDKDHKLNHSGIYKLNCNDCTAFYIGKTSRKFDIRIKEHVRCLNNNNFSEFANHIISNNHSFDKDTGINILHVNNKGKRLDNLEALEIKKSVKNNENIINNHKILSYSPILNMFPFTTPSISFSYPHPLPTPPPVTPYPHCNT